MEISFTQFRVYRECPWKYKLFFVDRRRIPATPASALGHAVHRALERFHRAGAPGKDELLDLFEGERLKGEFSGPAEVEQYRAKGRRMLERYFMREAERRTEVIGMEREFSYPLGRHMARGMIDRLDRRPEGGVEVIDYKTGEELGDDLQLRFYALGVRESLALEPSLLTVHYLAADKIVSRPYDPSREDELKAQILEAADRIEAGDFKPDTAFCARCDYRANCTHSISR